MFETALPSTDTQAPASTKKTSNPGKKATPTSITVTAVPAPAVATVGVSPTLAESPLPNPTVPALAPTTTKRPKPTTTTTTILLSPDTAPASDIEVSVEGGDGSTVQETGQTGIADPSKTRKKLPSITDELEGTTTAPDPLASPVTKPLDLRDPVATSTLPTARPTALPTAVTGNPEGPEVTKSASNPAASNPAVTNNGVTDSSVTKLPAPDRPRTEAEIVSGTDAHSPDAGTTTAIGSSSTPQASASPMKAGRLRGPLKLAGAGTLAALLLGLVAMFASLRAPITAFARQRLLHGFGLGLALAILTIAAIAIARELLNTPRSWPRVALKGLGFAALTAFAFVRRRSMKRGLSIVSEHFPSAKNVRVHSSIDGVAASRELDEHLPKSLRLGNVTGRRAKGRHIPELVRRLQKASLVEAIFAAVALLVAGFLLFV